MISKLLLFMLPVRKCERFLQAVSAVWKLLSSVK